MLFKIVANTFLALCLSACLPKHSSKTKIKSESQEILSGLSCQTSSSGCFEHVLMSDNASLPNVSLTGEDGFASFCDQMEGIVDLKDCSNKEDGCLFYVTDSKKEESLALILWNSDSSSLNLGCIKKYNL